MRPLLRPLSPLVRLTMALVSICALLVLLSDALLDAFPNRAEQQIELRKQMGNNLAVQVASMLRQADIDQLRLTLEELRSRLPRAQALVLRRADGQVLAKAGVPPPAASVSADERSTLNHIVVPLVSSGQRWGRLELSFQPDARPAILRWLAEPLVSTMLMVMGVGGLMIGLYLRRALQHLDPRAVIPERVQGAFDVMNDGVVVLDGKGRVLLANRAFRGLHPDAAQVKLGQALSALPWLTSGLGGGLDTHPWNRTLKSGEAVAGLTIELTGPDRPAQQLLVNTMPINDGDGKVRGCLTSVSDLSALHQAHADLHQAMAELSRSNEVVQQQNEQLTRLATRDPLTGCLNRRAFNDAYEPLFATAQSDGLALSCLVLDIDFFKKVNDTHGHGIGDRVIQEVARKLSDSARGPDLVCRYGGEEFVLVLPGLDAAGAVAVGERVRQRIADECGAAVREVPGMRVTVSVGVATLGAVVVKPADLIDAADQALYRAKRDGRNQVVHIQSPERHVEAHMALEA